MLLAYSGVQSRKLKLMQKGLKKMFKDAQVDKYVSLFTLPCNSEISDLRLRFLDNPLLIPMGEIRFGTLLFHRVLDFVF